jgi:hypothetical protein
MNLHMKLLTGVGLLSLLLPASAFAQYYPGYQRNQGAPFNRPTVSPFLNLFNGGTNPAINYYGIIRPQIDTRNSLMQLQQQINMGDQSTADLTTSLGVLTTGHPSFFLNHRRYFQTVGPGALGTGTHLQRGRQSSLQTATSYSQNRPVSRATSGSLGSLGSWRGGY